MRKIRIGLDAIWRTILRSPVELIISFIFLGISQYVEFSDFSHSYKYDYVESLKYYFLAILAVSYSANIVFSNRRRFIYYLSIFLVPTVLYAIFSLGYRADPISVAITLACSVLLVFVSKKLTDNKQFIQNAIKVVINIAVAVSLASIALLILVLIQNSIRSLFNYYIDDEVIEIAVNLCFFLFSPILFLILENRDRGVELRTNRFANILFNYILAPSFIIYGVILYLYFAKIIILWELPKGVISTTAIIFLIGGILVSACRMVLEKKVLNWVFDYFTYVAIPAVVLLGVSVFYRVFEYGLTGNRVYLLITFLTLALWVAIMLVKKYARFQYLSVFIIVTYMIFTYVPGISYKDFNRRADRRAEERGETIEKEIRSDSFSFLHNLEEKVDIEGYKYFVDYPESFVENDILIVQDSGRLIYKEDINDILRKLLMERGLVDYKSMSALSLRKYINEMGVYRNEDVLIKFNYIRVERSKRVREFQDSFEVVDVHVSWVMTK